MLKDNLTILLVEDEIKLAYTLSRALEKALGKQTQIKICSTAEAALQMFHIYTIDLLITDWRLPGMSGLDFIAQARKLNADLPVIFMTAYGSEDVEYEVCKISDVYINKPFEIPDFLQIVRQVLSVNDIFAPENPTQPTKLEPTPFQKVLILDDNPNTLALLRKTFQRNGFLVYGTGVLQEAEKYLSREQFDFFICGVTLDKGFGNHLLRKWGKALYETQTKVFVMSGDSWPSLINEEFEANFFFRKPVEIPAMLSLANSFTNL